MAGLAAKPITYPHHQIIYDEFGGYGIQVIMKPPGLLAPAKSSRPGRVKAEDAASPLGNPIPKLVGTASFVGQIIIDADHFGGVRLK
jgi:hypothetical protein